MTHREKKEKSRKRMAKRSRKINQKNGTHLRKT
jgi:hypothetical protein